MEDIGRVKERITRGGGEQGRGSRRKGLCVCVCVSVRMRERERERDK